MGVIRKLVTVLALDSSAALKGLVAYGRQWQVIEKVVATAASSIERNADRAAAAMARMATGAAQVRAGGGSSGAGASAGRGRPAGGAGRKGGDDLDRAISRANVSTARTGGLADGAKAIRDATAALGPLATKSDRAKAAVADLAAQVARNRKEMADLRAEAVRTGDAEGTLKARMQGLATATGQASVALAGARGELRKVDGGLIDAVKNAGKLRERFGALQVAAGNLIAGGLSTAFRGVVGSISDATKKAIDFESAFADVKKVLPDGTTAEQIKTVEKAVVDLSRKVAVDGPEGAAKLNAALLQTGLYTTESLIPAAEAAAKIGVAFDIGAGEAGDALAKLRVGGNLTQEQVEKLAGTFNHLSNNMPATAKQIIEAEGRVISIGNAANISAEQTTALVTAMIATGADADVAATGTKNFIKALGSGEAATKKQMHAFKALGLDARDVAKGLTAGGKSAEDTVKGVVSRIGELGKTSREQVLPVLIELFGSESISSIGPLATNIELLTKSFDLAGDSVAAANSVEKEYEARSKTTANAIQLLKNNVSALAIEFGNALLPHINNVVEFLTSPEGQEWGRGAVEKAVGAVTSLATGIGVLVSTVMSLTDAFGGTAVAIGVVAVGAASLVGPFGAALLAGTAAGWGIAAAFQGAKDAILGTTQLIDAAQKLRVDATGRKLGEIDAAGAEADAVTFARGQRAAQARKAGLDLEAAVVKKAGVGSFADLDKATRTSLATRQSKLMIAAQEGRGFEEELGAVGGQTSALSGGPGTGGGGRGGDAARFAALSDKVRRGVALRPSEAKEYTALSKLLDVAKSRKAGKGHKATKMDRQLAAIGGDVRGVLTAGGERDAGGDLQVHDDPLSRAVYDRQAKGGGAGGKDRSDGAGIGPGPNINTWNISTQVALAIDARSTGSVPENIASAGMRVANQAGVSFTGAAKLIAQQNAGGVMRG